MVKWKQKFYNDEQSAAPPTLSLPDYVSRRYYLFSFHLPQIPSSDMDIQTHCSLHGEGMMDYLPFSPKKGICNDTIAQDHI